MLFLFVVLSIQQIQVKNCTAVARYFFAGAHELVLYYHLAESGEIKFHSDTTILCSAFFKRAACGLGSFSINENSVLPCCAKCVTVCCSYVFK